MPNHVLNSIAASTISLKAKLTGIVLLGFALLLTISFFMLSRGIEKVTTEQLQDHELVVANLLAKEMTPAVRFKDSKRLGKIYENIAEDNDGLVHVRVLDAGGVELSGHGAAQESLQFGALITKALASGQVEAKVDGAMHAIAVPIHTEDAQALLGVAGFVWDGSHELAQQTSEIRSVFLVQFPIAFAAIVIIMFVISIIVVKPILRLSKAMVAVSKGQYALEIPFVARKDEIGTMARELQAFQSNLASNAEYQNARSQETELRRELLRTVGNRDMGRSW